ncbi:hypothetical protein AB0I84_30280 [Streptomyces spectabilis]|uniref:hypothetical protein n=1 Tax=Streptomyces spectabilis TaxID=68270 RepID=UPI0033FE8EB7
MAGHGAVPSGSSAVAALSTGAVADVPELRTLGRVLLWVAVAVWGVVWLRGSAPGPPPSEGGAPPRTP